MAWHVDDDGRRVYDGDDALQAWSLFDDALVTRYAPGVDDPSDLPAAVLAAQDDSFASVDAGQGYAYGVVRIHQD